MKIKNNKDANKVKKEIQTLKLAQECENAIDK